MPGDQLTQADVDKAFISQADVEKAFATRTKAPRLPVAVKNPMVGKDHVLQAEMLGAAHQGGGHLTPQQAMSRMSLAQDPAHNAQVLQTPGIPQTLRGFQAIGDVAEVVPSLAGAAQRGAVGQAATEVLMGQPWEAPGTYARARAAGTSQAGDLFKALRALHANDQGFLAKLDALQQHYYPFGVEQTQALATKSQLSPHAKQAEGAISANPLLRFAESIPLEAMNPENYLPFMAAGKIGQLGKAAGEFSRDAQKARAAGDASRVQHVAAKAADVSDAFGDLVHRRFAPLRRAAIATGSDPTQVLQAAKAHISARRAAAPRASTKAAEVFKDWDRPTAEQAVHDYQAVQHANALAAESPEVQKLAELLAKRAELMANPQRSMQDVEAALALNKEIEPLVKAAQLYKTHVRGGTPVLSDEVDTERLNALADYAQIAARAQGLTPERIANAERIAQATKEVEGMLDAYDPEILKAHERTGYFYQGGASVGEHQQSPAHIAPGVNSVKGVQQTAHHRTLLSNIEGGVGHATAPVIQLFKRDLERKYGLLADLEFRHKMKDLGLIEDVSFMKPSEDGTFEFFGTGARGQDELQKALGKRAQEELTTRGAVNAGINPNDLFDDKGNSKRMPSAAVSNKMRGKADAYDKAAAGAERVLQQIERSKGLVDGRLQKVAEAMYGSLERRIGQLRTAIGSKADPRLQDLEDYQTRIGEALGKAAPVKPERPVETSPPYARRNQMEDLEEQARQAEQAGEFDRAEELRAQREAVRSEPLRDAEAPPPKETKAEAPAATKPRVPKKALAESPKPPTKTRPEVKPPMASAPKGGIRRAIYDLAQDDIKTGTRAPRGSVRARLLKQGYKLDAGSAEMDNVWRSYKKYHDFYSKEAEAPPVVPREKKAPPVKAEPEQEFRTPESTSTAEPKPFEHYLNPEEPLPTGPQLHALEQETATRINALAKEFNDLGRETEGRRSFKPEETEDISKVDRRRAIEEEVRPLNKLAARIRKAQAEPQRVEAEQKATEAVAQVAPKAMNSAKPAEQVVAAKQAAEAFSITPKTKTDKAIDALDVRTARDSNRQQKHLKEATEPILTVGGRSAKAAAERFSRRRAEYAAKVAERDTLASLLRSARSAADDEELKAIVRHEMMDERLYTYLPGGRKLPTENTQPKYEGVPRLIPRGKKGREGQMVEHWRQGTSLLKPNEARGRGEAINVGLLDYAKDFMEGETAQSARFLDDPRLRKFRALARYSIVTNPMYHGVWNIRNNFMALGGSGPEFLHMAFTKAMPWGKDTEAWWDAFKADHAATLDELETWGGFNQGFHSDVGLRDNEPVTTQDALGNPIQQNGISTAEVMASKPSQLAKLAKGDKKGLAAGYSQAKALADKALLSFARWSAERTFDRMELWGAVKLYEKFKAEGMTPWEASSKIRSAFGDYAAVSPSSVLDRLFLFWPWKRSNLLFWMKHAWNYPIYTRPIAETRAERGERPDLGPGMANSYYGSNPNELVLYQYPDGRELVVDMPAPYVSTLNTGLDVVAPGDANASAMERFQGAGRFFFGSLEPFTAEVMRLNNSFTPGAEALPDSARVGHPGALMETPRDLVQGALHVAGDTAKGINAWADEASYLGDDQMPPGVRILSVLSAMGAGVYPRIVDPSKRRSFAEGRAKKLDALRAAQDANDTTTFKRLVRHNE